MLKTDSDSDLADATKLAEVVYKIHIEDDKIVK